MSIPVHAPRFDLQECCDEGAREFVERLHQRAERGDWYADSLSHLRDHVVIAVTLTDRDRRSALRTLRTDYVGPHLLLGDDETQQFATDLDPARQGVTLVSDGLPRELADVAADWLEREMRPSDHPGGVARAGPAMRAVGATRRVQGALPAGHVERFRPPIAWTTGQASRCVRTGEHVAVSSGRDGNLYGTAFIVP
jgi:hypothetical protein